MFVELKAAIHTSSQAVEMKIDQNAPLSLLFLLPFPLPHPGRLHLVTFVRRWGFFWFFEENTSHLFKVNITELPSSELYCCLFCFLDEKGKALCIRWSAGFKADAAETQDTSVCKSHRCTCITSASFSAESLYTLRLDYWQRWRGWRRATVERCS